MSRKVDVVVVGARVGGAATAMLLARAGLRVVCIDRSRPGSDTLSTHALMRGGVLQLQKWGLLDAIVHAGTPAIRRTVFHYDHESVAVSIKPAAGVGALYAPRRTLLDALLVDAARQAGVRFEFGAVVTGLARSPDGDVTGVQVQDRRAGRRWTHGAGLVIGADGRDSVVARHAGARQEFTGRHAGGYLYSYWTGLPTDGYEWIYRPGLAAGLIPTNDGATCLFVGSRPDRIESAVAAGGPAAAFATLAGAAGLHDRLAAATRVGSTRYARSLPPAHSRTAQGPGWALVGDAGQWMDPMSTHGMTSALRDAELLTSSILAAGTLQSAVGGYQQSRDRLSLPMLQTADEIASFTWAPERIRELLRALSSAMTDEVEALAVLGRAA
jgi:2-polyprenyl-6-methoxyphenol hydroxylase-like FAD-dependent oxidoreductase